MALFKSSKPAGSGVLNAVMSGFGDAVERRTGTGWSGSGRASEALKALRADARTLQPLDERFGALARHAGLAEADIRLVAAAAVSEYVVSGHLLAGALSGDDGPARLSVAMALEVAGVPATAEYAQLHLGDLAPVTTTGLLTVSGDGPALARRVEVAPPVLAHLAGDDKPTEAVLTMRTPTMPVETPGVDDVAAALDGGERLVWIHSPLGAAGPSLAAAAVEAVDGTWFAGDVALAPPGMEPDTAAAELILDATLRGGILVLLHAERVSQTVLSRAPLPILAVSQEPWDVTRAPHLPVTVTAKRLSLAERAAAWERIMGHKVEREIIALRLSAEQILAIGEHVWAEHARDDDPDDPVDSPARIRAAARMLGKSKSSKATAADPVTLDDLVLPDHTRAEVERLLNWARYRDDVTARGSLHGKGGKGSGIAALFAGSPGTGKTLAAHVIADALAMDIYQVEISSIVDKYIGETEKNLERVFTAAEAMNAVLFFDEADALFGSRSEVKDARDRYANQEVAYLLQRMEQFDGITILATNLRGNLDPAFSRRLHFMITFPDPDEPTRRQLWQRHLEPAGEIDETDPPDLDHLAKTVELAGGEIRNIVLAATYDAVAEGAPISMRHLRGAVRREYSKLGRRVPPIYLEPTDVGQPSTGRLGSWPPR